MADASKTIVLVTGANSGIGWETVKALLRSSRTYHILLGTRSLEKGEAALEALKEHVAESNTTVELLQLDVASDDSISNAFDKVQATHGRIDTLVNNAGNLMPPLPFILSCSTIHVLMSYAYLGIALDADCVYGDISMREAWNKAYDVNVTGANIMTHTFVPLLLKSSDPRLLFVASGLSSMERMSEAHYPVPPPLPAGLPKKAAVLPSAYRASKTALNMIMLSWHWVLKEDGVMVWAVSPGFLATGLGGQRASMARRGAAPASAGGELTATFIEGGKDADVGKVVGESGIQPF
ncbi:hypothetical protein Daus18300_002485 [Diaporthe australafricana]|uniref:NAD(P)-binding protein n=1 Tax=Diaporthe australafricana TaxID=127596 RepID=A0ABR3XPE4_9PEZI